MRNKKKNKVLLLLLLLLGISIGFAALSTTLKINGTANVTKNTWSVYWDNPQVTEGSVTTTAPELSAEENQTLNTIATWSTTLSLPGDFYEFTIDAVNNGTIDAMITDIQDTVTPALPNYISYTVTYADGVAIDENHLLPKKTGNTATTEKYKVRVEFLDTITPEQMDAIPEGGNTYTFTYHVIYSQADSTAVNKPRVMENDTWATIQANVQNDPTIYPVGSTKKIEMDIDNDGTPETYTLRVANNTTPSECSTEGFSQTACGFVLEFADVITTHRMNPYTNGTTNGDGNKGGWEYSEMRTYVNTDIYNALPSELRSKIIDTTVVSGYGANDSSNFTTTDKIYLFSTKEVWGKEGIANVINYDTAEIETRQLDYYENKGVTTSNYSGAIKKNLNGINSWWWLRSADSNYDDNFFNVSNGGLWTDSGTSNITDGVAPAFRIA